jgi:hypothetical protein
MRKMKKKTTSQSQSIPEWLADVFRVYRQTLAARSIDAERKPETNSTELGFLVRCETAALIALETKLKSGCGFGEGYLINGTSANRLSDIPSDQKKFIALLTDLGKLSSTRHCQGPRNGPD